MQKDQAYRQWEQMKRRPACRVDFRHFCLIVPCDHRTILVFFSTFVLRIRDFLFFSSFYLNSAVGILSLFCLHSFFPSTSFTLFQNYKVFLSFPSFPWFKKKTKSQTNGNVYGLNNVLVSSRCLSLFQWLSRPSRSRYRKKQRIWIRLLRKQIGKTLFKLYKLYKLYNSSKNFQLIHII